RHRTLIGWFRIEKNSKAFSATASRLVAENIPAEAAGNRVKRRSEKIAIRRCASSEAAGNVFFTALFVTKTNPRLKTGQSYRVNDWAGIHEGFDSALADPAITNRDAGSARRECSRTGFSLRPPIKAPTFLHPSESRGWDAL